MYTKRIKNKDHMFKAVAYGLFLYMQIFTAA